MFAKSQTILISQGEACIAGAQSQEQSADLAWVLKQSGTNPAVKLMAYSLRKIFRGSLDGLTVDVASFKQALAAAPRDVPRVLIPIHRSYFDFLAAGYLLFARQDLDIPLPHIAAAEEFGQVPFIGPLLARCGAFFIRRGQGKEDVELTSQIEDLVRKRETFEFFIEGTRSRSRQFLAPKRGLLRCLQGTGERFALFPIAITYDRVADEQSFVTELSGQAKPKMTLGKLFSWYRRMRRGEVNLGRMHISCAPPIILAPDSDIYSLAHSVNMALQKHTATTDYHLQVFCNHHANLGISVEWLARNISLRGGKLLSSSLDANLESNDVDAIIERSFQYQWLHLFVDEAVQRWPSNKALSDYASRVRYFQPPSIASSASQDPLLQSLLTCLFVPVANNYALTALTLAAMPSEQRFTKNELIQSAQVLATKMAIIADVPVIENAISALLDNQMLNKTLNQQLQRNAKESELKHYAEACQIAIDDK